ncbi:O-antigen ligase [Synechococcus sp. UW140]|uniref:O-antigen ligase family protein n=1 Tax=Synechococcus sp. UW140 TaxID=368503 RepID=UPI0010BD173C|nr:O-antigen ligase family protein [Synechococcus sp. UW140]
MLLSTDDTPSRPWSIVSSVSGVTALLTGLLLLTAPIQPGLLKHDAYRSVSLICFTLLMAGYYLKRAPSIRVSKRYALSAALLSVWGMVCALWSNSPDQALLFALLPPLFFLAIPILADSWHHHPWASGFSLAAAALCLFSLDSLHIISSWLTSEIPYRMPTVNPIRPYLFYNSRDANQFQILLIWSSLPCLIKGLQTPNGWIKRALLSVGLLIPAEGMFLILASKGDGALLAVLAGSITSWLLLRHKHSQALAWFGLALGLGTAAFLILNLSIGSGDLFGDLSARSAQELDPSRGRLRSWLAHANSMVTYQLWLGAGYRAIPTGSGLCGPHNILVSLTYSLGLPGLGLSALWASSMRWSTPKAALPIRVLAPGLFSALLIYQLIDEIWGFAPSLVLLSIVIAIACPLATESVAQKATTIELSRSIALIGLGLVTAFFVAAKMDPFIQGQPARQSCMMGFISPHLKEKIPKGIKRYQLLPDETTSFKPVGR